MSRIVDESADAFRDLPEALQNVLRRYGETRDDGDLNAVIFAVLEDLGSELGDVAADSDELNFIEDLGLDSLAIAEFVFFFEDIFQIKITNDALAGMRTLGELKAFLKAELV